MSRKGEINIFQINYRLLQFINYKKFDYFKDEFKHRIKIFTDQYLYSVPNIKSISKKEYIENIIIPLFYLIYGYVYKKYNEKQIESRNINNNQLICNMFNYFFEHKNPAIVKANAYYYLRFKQEKEDDKKSNTSNIYLLGYFKNQNDDIKNFLNNYIIKYLDKCFDIEEYSKVILIKNNIEEMGKSVKNIIDIYLTQFKPYSGINDLTIIDALNDTLYNKLYPEINDILYYINNIQKNIYNINKNALFLNDNVKLIKLEEISINKYNEIKDEYDIKYNQYSELKKKKDIIKKNIGLLIKNNDAEIELLQDLFKELQKSNSNLTKNNKSNKTKIFLKSVKEYDDDITKIIYTILHYLFIDDYGDYVAANISKVPSFYSIKGGYYENVLKSMSNMQKLNTTLNLNKITIKNNFSKLKELNSENNNYLNQCLQLYFLSLIINNRYKYKYLNDITMLYNGKLNDKLNDELKEYDQLNISKIQDVFIEKLRKYKKNLVKINKENEEKMENYKIELSKLPILNDLKKPEFESKLSESNKENIEKNIKEKKINYKELEQKYIQLENLFKKYDLEYYNIKDRYNKILENKLKLYYSPITIIDLVNTILKHDINYTIRTIGTKLNPSINNSIIINDIKTVVSDMINDMDTLKDEINEKLKEYQNK